MIDEFLTSADDLPPDPQRPDAAPLPKSGTLAEPATLANLIGSEAPSDDTAPETRTG